MHAGAVVIPVTTATTASLSELKPFQPPASCSLSCPESIHSKDDVDDAAAAGTESASQPDKILAQLAHVQESSEHPEET